MNKLSKSPRLSAYLIACSTEVTQTLNNTVIKNGGMNMTTVKWLMTLIKIKIR